MTNGLDEIDHRILGRLTENARLPVVDLARLLGLPRSTVAYRIEQLEKNGILKGYTTRRNHAALGQGITAFVMIQLGTMPIRATQEFGAKIGKIPGVEEIHVIAGEWDLVVKVRAADNRALFQLVQKLHPESNVGRSMTLMTFMTLKEPV